MVHSPLRKPMAFEKFTETGRSYRAKLSIRANGTIGLNAGAVNKFGLDKCDWVVLFYDREYNLVGIKPTKNEKEEGVLTINKGKTGAWISGRRFLDYYEITTTKTKRFDASWDEREKMIVAQIS
jgi:hypothetical protein